MLRVLDQNKNIITALTRYKNLAVKSVLHKYDQTLTFDARYEDIRNILHEEGYLETKEQRYVIKEINPSSDGRVKITATLDLEALEGKAWHFFESVEQTIDAGLRLAIAGTGWTIGDCEITKRRTLRVTNKSALDIIRQAESTYRAEIIFDSKLQKINIYETAGEDRGVYFKTNINMTQLQVESDTYEFFTELEPYGKNGLTIEEVNSGRIYVSNHQYATKNKRYIWKDDRYTVAQSLKEDAQAKLDDMSKPYVSYKAKVIDLAKAMYAMRQILLVPEENMLLMPNGRMLAFETGSPGRYGNLSYGLGDTITLMDPATGTREKQRIVELTVYPEEIGDRDSCTLANMVITFDEAAQRFEDSAETVDNITSDNGTVSGSAIDSVSASQVTGLGAAIEGSAAVTNLQAQYVTVSGRVTAVEGEFGTLSANVAHFEEAYVQDLSAVNARITNLQADYANIALARIGVLEATAAQITSLLAGQMAATEAQMIHLNAQNAVIDSAFLRNLVSNNISVNDLQAGMISTDIFQIGSDDGGILIAGNTQTFTDGDGNVRLQIGEDAHGDFTFVLYDEDGEGILLDQDGIHPSAIGDGLIVDRNVASGANISASKLNINSLWDIMLDDTTHQWQSSQIVMDEQGQTLAQSYVQMTQQMSINTQTVTSAEAAARAAAQSAQAAIDALDGISTLDAYSLQLSADAAVVATNPDGSGGNYTDVFVIATAVMGQTDVSSQSTFTETHSSNVSGTWNASNRKFQVTGMTGNNGYVEISATQGAVTVSKRFSISKAIAGASGTVYKLITSAELIKKKANGTLEPASITLTSYMATGGGDPAPYSGYFLIEESTDGTTYTEEYRSSLPERLIIWTPASGTLIVRCTLITSAGTLLDQRNILILADVEEMADTIEVLRGTITQTNSRVANIETGIDGLRIDLEDTQTELSTVTDGTLDFQPLYEVNGTNVIVTAHVYRKGVDVTEDYPSSWYEWYVRNDNGRTLFSTGYTATIPLSNFGYNGGVTARFIIYDEAPLVMPDNGGSLINETQNRTITVNNGL